MDSRIQRTWVDIDLNALRSNLDMIRQHTEGAEVMCIVKADAYGHGVEHITAELQRLGVRWFGVSNIDEAVELRRHGIEGDILILGYTAPKAAGLLASNGISQSVFSEEYAEQLSEAAEALGCTVKCHLKLDSGMGRIGFDCRSEESINKQADVCERICRLSRLNFTGAFTHFAVADEGENGEQYTRIQFANFTAILDKLKDRGVEFRWRHCCNSAGTLEYPEAHLDMVRPGIILYGLSPSHVLDGKYPLKPVMQLRTVVSMVKTLKKGYSLSYGRTFTADRDMVVATAPIGYADGYPRVLSNGQEMLIHGKRAPIIGRVCMDQLMLDVTDIPDVCEGDIVTAFGVDGDEFIPVEELTDKLGTVNYELVCRMTRRVPRVYHRDGKAVTQTDYLM